MLYSSDSSSWRSISGRRGFTLIEILVAVGIIALLLAILIPVFHNARPAAEKAAAMSQLTGLQSSIQQYYSEFNSYPPSTLQSVYGPLVAGRGSVMLAQALMGFLPYGVDGAGSNQGGYPASPPAGEPELGFRTRPGAMGGKIYGPYAPANRKTYSRVTPGTEEFFVDPWGKEILYFRSVSPVPANVTRIFGNGSVLNYFFLRDDCSITASGALPDISNMIPPASGSAFFHLIHPGGSGFNGYFGGSVVGSDSYLLVSAGPDGVYFTGDDLVVGKP